MSDPRRSVPGPSTEGSPPPSAPLSDAYLANCTADTHVVLRVIRAGQTYYECASCGQPFAAVVEDPTAGSDQAGDLK